MSSEPAHARRFQYAVNQEVAMRRSGLFPLVVSALVLGGCSNGGDDTAPSTSAAPVTSAAPSTSAVPSTVATLELVSSPQFVNRLIPGHRPLALVSASAAATFGGSTISLAGASVTVEPAAVSAGGVAEVWVDLPEVTEDVPFTVTITGTAGALTKSVTVSATAVPGIDDLAATAQQIVARFLLDAASAMPELPDDPATLTNGTPVAGLLVVTHYAWFTDAYEIGLAWHIMVAPDDFAEMYVRPRGALVPTRAFRINTWSTALAGGQYTFSEITPPPEVTR